MQCLYSGQRQLFDGYQDVNNNNNNWISAAAAVLIDMLSIHCIYINLPQENPFQV